MKYRLRPAGGVECIRRANIVKIKLSTSVAERNRISKARRQFLNTRCDIHTNGVPNICNGRNSKLINYELYSYGVCVYRKKRMVPRDERGRICWPRIPWTIWSMEKKSLYALKITRTRVYNVKYIRTLFLFSLLFVRTPLFI